MELNIVEGIENQLVKTVGKDDSASKCGSGLLPVFATPALVAFMEQTAHTSIEKFLPEGCTSVGIEIDVKHLKATPLGMQARCHST
ncbi:MAG: dihydrolipoamide acyltransferase, partial [Bacteroidales bacterium]|nr:dihydrolipoamide acyltransferase [Bacteroidales bacterium]